MKRFIATLLLSLATPTVLAQAWPAKPVRIINAFAPGGPSDLLSRAVGDKLQGIWGQPVIVEAKPGADGLIGMEFAAKSPADGYTIVTVPVGNAVLLPNLRSKLPYDIAKDFVPITLLATVQNVLVVGANVPANTLKELIAYAKANPGKLSFASPGAGSSPHIAGEMLKSATGMDMIHVAYKGSPQYVIDLLTGRLEVAFATMANVIPHIKTNRLRLLATTMDTRDPQFPQVPTIAEAGVTGYDMRSWYGLLTTAGTPLANVDKLNAEVVRILALPELRTQYQVAGLYAASTSPSAFATYIATEREKWGKLAKSADLKPE